MQILSIPVPLTGHWTQGDQTPFNKDTERGNWFALRWSSSDFSTWQALVASVTKTVGLR